MQSAYISTRISTVFPLTATRPANFKARTHRGENREIERIASIAVVPEPKYATELAVTRAIADGPFTGFATTAYADAKRYQAYLKSLEPRKFFRRKNSTAVVARSAMFVPGYAN